MLTTILIAVAPSRTLFERLLFPKGDGPLNFTWEFLYSLAIIAMIVNAFVSAVAVIGIWAERKIAGHMQCRLGPNRVGPIGIFQSFADGIKLFFKEDLIPAQADHPLFRLAPYLAFSPVFAAFVAMPFGPDMTFEPRLNVGVFYILAMLSMEVMGVILAGWASNNKWSVYGAMREACQMVSYEIPLGLSIIVAVMAAGTLNMVELGHMQAGGLHTWLIFRNPFVFVAFFLYFVASLASNKRAPFDLPESESELVAGFHTEYSGLRWAFFFFAEYAAMFVVGGIQAGLFLGGWNDPFGLIGYFHHKFTVVTPNDWGLLVVNLAGATIFVAKATLIMFVQMWLRWTLPRPRIDQVLYACVKVLLPLACAMLLGAAFWELLVAQSTIRPWHNGVYQVLSAGQNRVQFGSVAFLTQVVLMVLGVGGFFAVLAWVGYAFVTGRRQTLRLTDPSPIIDEIPAAAVVAPASKA